MIKSFNAFLAGLNQQGFDRLSPHLLSIYVGDGERLQQAGAPVKWVYFPVGSLLSINSTSRAGRSVETALIGNEGCSGLVEACASGVSHLDAVVQIPGAMLRSPAHVCRSLAASNAAFRKSMLQLAELQINEARQGVCCHALHSVEQRLCSWLLENLDRSGGRNPLPFTHDLIAARLGSQRTAISMLSANFHRQGLINSTRGQLRISDPAGLEALACECRHRGIEDRVRLNCAAISAVPSSRLGTWPLPNEAPRNRSPAPSA